jgi:signal peptidase I
MEPNFYNGDYLIIDEITYRLEDPERGDVVVFRFPDDPGQFFIKRIVGLPGETIEIEGNEVVIWNETYPNGFILNESFYLSKDQHTVGNMRLKLDGDEYFVMGDNRLESSDSRRWGPVDEDHIIGRAVLRAWPVDRFMKLEGPSYGFQLI